MLIRLIDCAYSGISFLYIILYAVDDVGKLKCQLQEMKGRQARQVGRGRFGSVRLPTYIYKIEIYRKKNNKQQPTNNNINNTIQ